MEVLEACTSYETADFDETCHFFGHLIGLERVIEWDRPDGRGAYFGAGGTMVVEITNAPRQGRSSHEPRGDGLAVTVMVGDAKKALAEFEERGGIADQPMAELDWGRYFGARDPNGVRIWIMERRGPWAHKARRFRSKS